MYTRKRKDVDIITDCNISMQLCVRHLTEGKFCYLLDGPRINAFCSAMISTLAAINF